MKRRRLVLLGLFAAGLQMCSTHAAVILSVDVGNRPLVGNTAGSQRRRRRFMPPH